MTEVDLGSHFDGFVQEQVASGRFRDASDVVRAGLDLLERRERDRAAHRATLERELAAAYDDPSPGLSIDEVFDRLERRHAARMAAAPDAP